MVKEPRQNSTRRGVLRGTAAGGLLGFGSSSDRRFSFLDDKSEYAFVDNFEDGSIDNQPVWKDYLDEGNFSASVVDQPALSSGSKALRVVETTGGATSGIIGWKSGVDGWDSEWTLSGRFYTEEVPLESRYQTHNIKAGIDNQDNIGRLSVAVGFRDGAGNRKPFEIGGDVISDVQTTTSVQWEEDTLYKYEISHDGNGVYTARLWTTQESRPDSPSAKSVGESLPAGSLSAGIGINGALDKPLHIDHGVMRFERGGADSGPSEPPVGDPSELNELLDQKEQLIGQIRSNADSIEQTDQPVDVAAKEFVNSTKRTIDQGGLATEDTKQYTEAMRRLVATEKISKKSSGESVSEITTRAGNAVLNAILTASVSLITAGVGGAPVNSRATKLIGEQVSGGQKAVLNTFAGKFGSLSTKFDNLTSRRSTEFGEVVSEYVEDTPRKFRMNKGLSDDQTAVFLNALKDESVAGIINLAKGYNRIAPDGLVPELQKKVGEVKEEINAFFFRYYWFGSGVAEYDFNFPEPSIPKKKSFSVDFSWLPIPTLGTEAEFSIQVDQQDQLAVQNQIDTYRERAQDIAQYADLLSVPEAGIETTLTDSVNLLKNQASDGQLERQNPADRSEIVGDTTKSIDALTSASNALFGIISKLLDGILAASIAIGLAIVVIYAGIFAASVASGAGVATLPVSTGVLFTLLGILGVVDLLLVSARVAAIGRVLSSVAQIHNVGAAAIVSDYLDEVI
jgi:hypothetical protein